MNAHAPLELHAALAEGACERIAKINELENDTPPATDAHVHPSASLPAQYSSNGTLHIKGCE